MRVRIEKLEADKVELLAEVSELGDREAKAREVRQLAEEEASRLKASIQAMEVDKQVLIRKVKEFTMTGEYLRSNMVKLMDGYLSRLKLGLSTAGSACQPMQTF